MGVEPVVPVPMGVEVEEDGGAVEGWGKGKGVVELATTGRPTMSMLQGNEGKARADVAGMSELFLSGEWERQSSEWERGNVESSYSFSREW